MTELSVEVKVTYVKYPFVNRWNDNYVSMSCHRCHKGMEERFISPFLEWHICDKCMEEDDV